MEQSFKKLYSPWQAGSASLLGGPLATLYIVYSNFLILEKHKEAKETLYLGIVICVIVFVSLMFFVEKISSLTVPFASCFAALSIVSKRQLEKKKITESTQFVFQENWKVLVVAIIAIFTTFIFGYIMSMIFQILGWMHHYE